MKFQLILITSILLAICVPTAHARDRLKLQTTIIKGNKEMPQIVYIIPWKDMKDHSQTEQTLVLHSLFGGLFNPVHIDATRPTKTHKKVDTKK